MENNEKKPKASKEVLMIIVVVVLAFGLTVAGIVYLTNFLIGDSGTPSKPTIAEQPVPQAPDPVVRFTDNESEATDNMTALLPEQPAAPAPAAPAPVPPQPTTPQVATPPTTAPAPTPIMPAAPQVVTVSPVKGNYQLQLSAFRSEQKARTEAQKYQKDYPDIYVIKADLGDDGVWYRVRCCSAETQDELKKIKTEMESKYTVTPYIVKVN